MLHPPYDRESDPELRRAIEGLRASDFVMDKVENHDPSLGYNTLEGLVEEDVVQAFEQLLADSAGIAEEPRERWRTSDAGHPRLRRRPLSRAASRRVRGG